jgi:hypothetical protein
MALKEIKRRHGVGEALKEQVAQAEEMIERYGWQNMTVAPYGHAEPLMKVIGWVKDYDQYTSGSKETIILIWNGLAQVLNAWEESEKQKTVPVRLLRGKHKGERRMMSPEFAELFAEDGAVEIIQA